MKKRRVRILRRAVQDLVEIERYLEREAGAAAASIIEEIMTGIERLARFPMSAPRPRDLRLRDLGFRCLARGRYLVFYKPGAVVYVYRVLHHKRAYERLL